MRMDRADLYKPRSQKLSCGFLNDWLSPSPLGSRSLLKSIWKIWRQPHCFTRLIDLNRLFHWRGISTCEFIYSKFHVFKPCLPASRHLFFHSFVNSLFHSSQCFLIPFSLPVRWKANRMATPILMIIFIRVVLLLGFCFCCGNIA